MTWLRGAALTLVGNVLGLFLAVWLIGEIEAHTLAAAIIGGVAFGLANLLLRPLVRLAVGRLTHDPSDPRSKSTVAVMTVALFAINIALLGITALLVKNLDVQGFGGLLKGTVVIWLVNLAVHLSFGREHKAVAS